MLFTAPLAKLLCILLVAMSRDHDIIRYFVLPLLGFAWNIKDRNTSKSSWQAFQHARPSFHGHICESENTPTNVCSHARFWHQRLSAKLLTPWNNEKRKILERYMVSYCCYTTRIHLSPTDIESGRSEDPAVLLSAVLLQLVASIRVIERSPVRANWLIRNWDQRCGKTRWTATKGNEIEKERGEGNQREFTWRSRLYSAHKLQFNLPRTAPIGASNFEKIARRGPFSRTVEKLYV